MMINKYIKACLFVLVALVVMVAAFAYYLDWTLDQQRLKAVSDQVIFSKICQNKEVIKEQPRLYLSDFSTKDLSDLEFFLIRNHSVLLKKKVIGSVAAVDHDNTSVKIPFVNFKKSDTIILKINATYYFTLTGFSYYAYLHYGMIGYLGSYDCRLSSDFMVNGVQKNGVLDKKAALLRNPLP